jgi:hypothetical protein
LERRQREGINDADHDSRKLASDGVRLPGVHPRRTAPQIPASDAASEGTAAHKIMEQISGRDLSSLDDVDVVGIADLHRVDAEALRMHAVNGIWMWKRIRPAFVIGTRGEAELKATVAGINVTGHVDLMASDDEIANLADWKFGRLDRDYYHQLAGYMALALKAHPNFKRVTASICWMRDREIEPYSMDREQAEAWEAHLEAEIVRWDGRTFRPGALRPLSALPRLPGGARRGEGAGRDVRRRRRHRQGRRGARRNAGAEMLALYRRTKMVAKFCESLQDLVKREGRPRRADRRRGRLRTAVRPERWRARRRPAEGDGRCCKRTFATTRSGPSKVSISQAEKLVRAKAPPRKGAEARRRFAAELEAVGAFSKKPSRQFREVRTGTTTERRRPMSTSEAAASAAQSAPTNKHHRARPGRAPEPAQDDPSLNGSISAFASSGNFITAQRIAKALAASTVVPAAYQGNIENCLIALDMASRIGATPLAVMQNLHVINGNPGWAAKFLVATVNTSRRFSPIRYRFVGTEGQDDWGCRAVARDEHGEELVGPLVTIKMAKLEGWYDKTGSKWLTMPEVMLMYRSASFWVKVYAPEMSLGMQTSEELDDMAPGPMDVRPSSRTSRTPKRPTPGAGCRSGIGQRRRR